MFGAVWSGLKRRLTKPLIGLGAVSVSTVMAACYGPDPGERYHPGENEYCEELLQGTCKDETGSMPYECVDYCNYLRDQKINNDDIEIPECCPE